MNKRELEILKIGFEAGKKAIEMHPDDDEYDTIRLDEAIQQVKNLDIPHVVGRSEQFICPCCGSDKTYKTEAYHCNRCAVTTEV